MSAVLEALRFLTVFRWRSERPSDERTLSASVTYFPLVGALLGSGLALVEVLFAARVPDPLRAVIEVGLLVIWTRGLHLDGLADTADALGSGKDREAMLAIMRDSHIGAFGVMAIVFDVLAKTALLMALPPSTRCAACFLMPLAGRYVLSLALTCFPYARPSGKASAFFAGARAARLGGATLLALIFATLAAPARGWEVLALVALYTLLAGRRHVARFGGLTGDVLGALCETGEILALFAGYAFLR